MTPWQAVLVDDERSARRTLRTLLDAHDGVEVVGEAEDVAGAIECVRANGANLVFLDVKLVGELGLDLLPKLDSGVKVIVVSAFNEFAAQAFQANAFDYLLKPVDPARLSVSLARLATPPAANGLDGDGDLRRPLNGDGDGNGNGDGDGDGMLPPLTLNDRLFLRMNDAMGFLPVHLIRAVLADRDHAELILGDGRKVRVRKPLREWAQRLPARHFVQIHRSTVINLDAVDRVEEWSHQSFRIHIKGHGEPFAMSRRYAAKVRARLA